jgi:type IV pilus assembly protein PilE
MVSLRGKMKKEKGLTLIELLIVLLIVGILAAVAIPVYTNYMQRARRADAKTALEQLRASEEMFRAENGAYTADFALLNATWGGPPAIVGDYDITLFSNGTTLFTGTATPNKARQAPDGPLTIDQDNTKLPADKWAK